MITYRPEYIECLYASMTTANLNTLKAALSWLVMLRRTPVANQLSMSWGAWERDVFGLLPLVPADWSQSCWTKMLDTGIVASLLDLGDCEGCDDDYDDEDFDESEFFIGLSQLLSERPLLKTRPDAMSLLAGVTRPVQVEEGYILCGAYSAMVPVERQADGPIVWHYERKESRGAELQVDDLESLRGEWYQTFDLDLLITAPAHIGWSREGELLLGTDQHTHNTTWAPKPEKPEAPYYYSMNLWKIYRYMGFTMDHDYSKTLRNSQYCPWILYDVSTKRAWLVPATNLLLYMVSTFTKTFGTQQFPLPTSSEGALDFLLQNKNHVIQLSPGKTATLGDLVSGFAANLNKIFPISIGRGWIVGHQLMDLIHSIETPAPAIFRLRPRPSWDALLEGIPCLLAADMGDVIVGNRSRATNSPCNRLLTDQNFLAATVSTINDISYYQGRRILANSGIRKLPGGTWIASDRAFIHCCDHQQDSDDENCWQKPIFKFTQSITKWPNLKKKSQTARHIPENAVVVFGARGNRFPWLDRLREAHVIFSIRCSRIYWLPCIKDEDIFERMTEDGIKVSFPDMSVSVRNRWDFYRG